MCLPWEAALRATKGGDVTKRGSDAASASSFRDISSVRDADERSRPLEATVPLAG